MVSRCGRWPPSGVVAPRISPATAMPVLANRRSNTSRCCRARTVVGAATSTCQPAKAALAAARNATSVLPKPTSPHTRRSMGRPAARSACTASMAARWQGVSGWGKRRCRAAAPERCSMAGAVTAARAAAACASWVAVACTSASTSARRRRQASPPIWSGAWPSPPRRQMRPRSQAETSSSASSAKRIARRFSPSTTRKACRRAMPWSSCTTKSPSRGASASCRAAWVGRARNRGPMGRISRPGARRPSWMSSRTTKMLGLVGQASAAWASRPRRARLAATRVGSARRAAWVVA